MVLEQYYLGCLAHASYLIADEASGQAAVVDPQRDVERYLEDAAALGCRIDHVFLTHFHADFVAGHLELREQTGAVIHLGAQAEAEYRFERMADGAIVQLGEVRLTVLETPGHSPESISILVYDPSHGPQAPYAVADEVTRTWRVPTREAASSALKVPLTSMSYIASSSRIGLRTKARWTTA